MKDELQQFLSHFPQGASQEIEEYVIDRVLKNSRYIFTRRIGSFQFGYCTHCKQEYVTDEYLKPATKEICKKCQSNCTVKASGLGRKYLCDAAYIVYYEKSLINKNAIIARGIYVERDYSGDYFRVQTQFKPKYLYLFEPGKSECYYLSGYHGGYIKNKVESGWKDYHCWFNKECSFESIKAAIMGTPFQYSTWEHYTDSYNDHDMVRFFDLYCKYPCVEFLTKAGMRYFVSAKITGNVTYGAINWKGIKAQDVLKLNGQQIREIRTYEGDLHPLTLRLQQIVRKDGSKLRLTELQKIASKYYGCFEDLKKVLKYATLQRAINYLEKQSSIQKAAKIGDSGPMSVARTWRDYINDCTKLELDLRNEQILFPRNLHEAHQFTLKQVKDKADELLNAKVRSRAEKLMKNCFEKDGLLIRPALSATELIAEGKALQHCVGRYTEDYAKGNTELYFVRRCLKPDIPFYTMELQKGQVVQCHGFMNCSMTPEIRAFVDAFKVEKLEKKQVRVKTQNQVVVAV